MKTKKILLPMLLTTLCATLSSCGKDKNKVWAAYSTENLISDWDYFDGEEDNEIYTKRDKTLRFSCLKNENEGVQLMITPDTYVESFDFELPDVSGSNGKITKDHFSVSAAYYMDVEASNERTAFAGYYPDALIPLENFKFRRMNFIDEGRTQALYINLKTDKDTPAGEYKGKGKLILDKNSVEIPFEVKVYDAVLPDAVHQQSGFGVWYEQIPKAEGKNAGSELDKLYYDFAVSKRLGPLDLPPEYRASNSSYVDSLATMVANDERISASRLPVNQGTATEDNIRDLFQKMIDKNLELRAAGDTTIDLFKKVYFYIDDEPSAASFDLVKKHDKTIFDLKKSMNSQLSEYPDLVESFTHIKNIVTKEFIEEMAATNDSGGIQTWCPQMQHFQTKQARETYQARQAHADRDYGENVWWYTCYDPQSPYPNFHLDSKLILSRILRYMQFAYHVEGQIFWNICYYSSWQGGFEGPRNVWQDANSWEGCACDGMLVYPGISFGIKGPITTLRLESILASNEEYEYLWMINEKVQEYNASHGTSYVTDNLLSKYYTALFTDMIPNTDVESFENIRLEILKVVEALYTNIDSGMSLLLA